MKINHLDRTSRISPKRADVFKIGMREWITIGQSSIQSAARDRITTNAASLAFHWFLAIFPAVIASIGLSHLIGMSPSVLQKVTKDASILLPTTASTPLIQALKTPVSSAGSGLALIAGTLTAIWSSIEAMAALEVGLDVAYEIESDKGMIGRRLKAIPLLLVTILLGGGAFLLLILGVPLSQIISGAIPVGNTEFMILFDAIRWLGAAILIFLLLSAYFSYGPNRDISRWEWLSPGSLCTLVMWIISSIAFSFYLNDFGHSSKSYGAFAGVAVLLLWLYLTGISVLFGAEVNHELERKTATARKTESLT